METLEDVTHFLAICPKYNEIHFKYFGKYLLLFDELIEILNGKYTWKKLAKYIFELLLLRSKFIQCDATSILT